MLPYSSTNGSYVYSDVTYLFHTMIKRFDPTASPVLSSVIDSIESSIECSKYDQVANRIGVCLPGDVTFKDRENKALAEKGFGSCLIKSYDYGSWDVFIIVDMKNCIQANLTEREITAVVFHELGHILNEPELPDEPTFEFCLFMEFNSVEKYWTECENQIA